MRLKALVVTAAAIVMLGILAAVVRVQTDESDVVDAVVLPSACDNLAAVTASLASDAGAPVHTVEIFGVDGDAASHDTISTLAASCASQRER